MGAPVKLYLLVCALSGRCVVRAWNPAGARALARLASNDTNWLAVDKASCELIGDATGLFPEPEVLVSWFS